MHTFLSIFKQFKSNEKVGNTDNSNAKKIYHDTINIYRNIKIPKPSILGFSFAPAGLLFPYYLGVSKYLMDKGYINENVALSGSSAGAIIAVICGLRMNELSVFKLLYALEYNFYKYGTRGRMKIELEKQIRKILRNDDHLRLNNRPQPVGINYSRIGFTGFSRVTVTNYRSVDDLVSCLIASCNIPCYLSTSPLVRVRDHYALDGFFSDTQSFGCPNMSNVEQQIRVLPFDASRVVPYLAPSQVVSPDLCRFDHLLTKQDIEEFSNYSLNSKPPIPEDVGEKSINSNINSTLKVEIQIQNDAKFRERLPSVIWEENQEFGSNHIHEKDHPVEKNGEENNIQKIIGNMINSEKLDMHINDEANANVIAEVSSEYCENRRNNFLFNTNNDDQNNDKISNINLHKRQKSYWNNFLSCYKLSGNLLCFPSTTKFVKSQLKTIYDNNEVVSKNKDTYKLPEGIHMTWSTLLALALTPVDNTEVLLRLYELGRADAFRWAKLYERKKMYDSI